MFKELWDTINYYIEKKSFIIILIIINAVGSLYGFYWYRNQLLDSPLEFLIFVPDSPLSSTIFTVFLILYLMNKRVALIEAFASITLFKYGIWAISIIFWGAWQVEPSFIKIIMIDTISWVDVMLIIGHLGMALEALIFFKKYTYGFFSILIVGIWIYVNDILDYTLGINPWLPQSLNPLTHQVGEFTLILSGATLLIFYLLSIYRRKKE